MKKGFYSIVFVALVSFSCSKQNQSPETPLNEKVDTADSRALLQYAGRFVNGPYGSATGSAKIYELGNAQFMLALDSVSVSNGPDLHVYLSKEVQPLHFIDLGKLKSTNGYQLYNISGMPDFTAYRYALIHCQQYNHLFGSAELKK